MARSEFVIARSLTIFVHTDSLKVFFYCFALLYCLLLFVLFPANGGNESESESQTIRKGIGIGIPLHKRGEVGRVMGW